MDHSFFPFKKFLKGKDISKDQNTGIMYLKEIHKGRFRNYKNQSLALKKNYFKKFA